MWTHCGTACTDEYQLASLAMLIMMSIDDRRKHSIDRAPFAYQANVQEGTRYSTVYWLCALVTNLVASLLLRVLEGHVNNTAHS